MSTNRLPKLILSAALIIAALVALQAFRPSADPKASVPAYTGRGDYQHNESQYFQPYTGRGDYQRYESQFFQPDANVPEIDPSYVGMGDLHRYEAQSSIQNSAIPGSDHPYIGMGDLRRFEALQESEDAGEITP